VRSWKIVALALAGVPAAGSAPMQCPSDDRPPPPTVPEAPEECYRLAQQLLEEGDVDGWRTALQYVIDRFPDSRYAASAQDDLRRGPRPMSGDGGTEPGP